jgi:hypothetical protein
MKLNDITNKIMKLDYFKEIETDSNVAIVSKNLKFQIGSLLDQIITV